MLKSVWQSIKDVFHTAKELERQMTIAVLLRMPDDIKRRFDYVKSPERISLINQSISDLDDFADAAKRMSKRSEMNQGISELKKTIGNLETVKQEIQESIDTLEKTIQKTKSKPIQSIKEIIKSHAVKCKTVVLQFDVATGKSHASIEYLIERCIESSSNIPFNVVYVAPKSCIDRAIQQTKSTLRKLGVSFKHDTTYHMINLTDYNASIGFIKDASLWKVHTSLVDIMLYDEIDRFKNDSLTGFDKRSTNIVIGTPWKDSEQNITMSYLEYYKGFSYFKFPSGYNK